MAIRGQSINLFFRAYQAGATYDESVGNITVNVYKDAAAGAASTNSVVRLQAGVYRLTVTSSETDADAWLAVPVSSTSGVELVQVGVSTVRIPTVAPGATNGLPIIGTAPLTFLTGDAFARLGSPAGASVSADVAAVAAKTTNLPSSPAAVGSAMTLADGAITDAKFTIATDAAGRATGVVSMIRRLHQKWFNRSTRDRSTGIVTMYGDDDATALGTHTQSTAGDTVDTSGKWS